MLYLSCCFLQWPQSISRDGVIDQEEFRQALGVGVSPVFADRIFAIFDLNHDHFLSFDEFIQGLSGFCEKANLEEKLQRECLPHIAIFLCV